MQHTGAWLAERHMQVLHPSEVACMWDDEGCVLVRASGVFLHGRVVRFWTRADRLCEFKKRLY